MKTHIITVLALLLALISPKTIIGQISYPETIEKGADYQINTGNPPPLQAIKSITLKAGVWIKEGTKLQIELKPGSYTPVSLDTNQNYIYSRSYQVAINNYQQITQNSDVIEQITYVDGLGRPMQQNQIKHGPDYQDLITHIEYDQYGRQAKEYLPYPEINSKSGSYIPNNYARYNTQIYYRDAYPTEMNQGYPNPYTEKKYDQSPLNRVLQQGAPGESWKIGSDHEIEYHQDVNTLADQVYHLTLVKNTEGKLALTFSANSESKYYPTGSLYKTVTKDENHTGTTKNNTVEEYKNQLGQVVLKRTYNTTTNNTAEAHDTYYVYDSYGNLKQVIPPLVVIEELIDTTQEPELVPDYNYLGNSSVKDIFFTDIGGPNSGGSFEISIKDNNLEVNMTGGTNHKKLIEVIIPINTNCPLPNATLGDLVTSYKDVNGTTIDNTGAYSAKIEDGNFKIIKNTEEEVDRVVFNGSLALDPTCKIGEHTIYPINTTTQDNLTYQYIYDDKNRLIQKQIPGKGQENIIYDQLDRVLFTQDAKQKQAHQWNYVKYDAYSRVIETGTYTNTHAITREALQNIVNTTNITSILTDGNPPSITISPKSYTYYDNYNFDTLNAYVPPTVYGVPTTNQVQGLTTGTKTKVEDSNQWITTLLYYDQYGRVIYAYNINHYLQTRDITQTEYDFTGKIIQTKTYHDKEGHDQIQIDEHYTYDHVGRLLTQEQQINNNPKKELIVSNSYDALGQLKSKKVGNSSSAPLQKVDYKYNIRGWLTHINNPSNPTTGDLFNFEIRYNNPTPGTAPLFNGNISQTYWRTDNTDNSLKQYNYSYDALNRLKIARYKNEGTEQYNKNYLESLQYDKNGNITFLHRTGDVVQQANLEWMDYMTYHYQGNQLQRIAETGQKEAGFTTSQSATDTQVQYEYDINGNLIKDQNKDISSITYNTQNLPKTITFGTGNTIQYTYDAAGIKQQKQVSENGQTITTQYAGAYTYKKVNNTPETLEYITQPEGYITPEANGTYQYTYQYKDHLGNIRLAYSDSNQDGIVTKAEIIEEHNYYPFGLKHQGYNNVVTGKEHKYQTFQGQEEEEELGKNTYAYQWRDYNPAIARFNKIDRFAEKYMTTSPYSFTMNNPIYFTEIKGDSIDVSLALRQDKNSLRTLVKDAQEKTGLSFTLKDGKMGYKKDSNGNAIISKDADGNPIGSSEARGLMTSAIDNKTTVKVQFGEVKGGSGEAFNVNGQEYITLDPKGIQSMMDGSSSGLNNTTFGFAMTAFHEIDHTSIGSHIGHGSEETTFGQTGTVVDRMNKIRSQLGPSYGQRTSYAAMKTSVGNIIPFSHGANSFLKSGNPSPGLLIMQSNSNNSFTRKMYKTIRY